jgi:hypothetical protein
VPLEKATVMNYLYTKHASVRAQQRGVPPIITAWLLDYGEEMFDGHGGVLRRFTHRSIRNMARDFGQTPLKRMSEFLRCYLVQSSTDGTILTVGKCHSSRRFQRH